MRGYAAFPNGNRPHDVFEMSGAITTIEQSIDQLRIGGQLVLVDSVLTKQAAQLASEQVVRKLLRVEGVHNYMPVDLQTANGLWDQSSRRYPFSALVAHKAKLLARSRRKRVGASTCLRASCERYGLADGLLVTLNVTAALGTGIP